MADSGRLPGKTVRQLRDKRCESRYRVWRDEALRPANPNPDPQIESDEDVDGAPERQLPAIEGTRRRARSPRVRHVGVLGAAPCPFVWKVEKN